MKCCAKHDWQNGKCAKCGVGQCSHIVLAGHRCMLRVITNGSWAPHVWVKADKKKCMIHQSKEKP